MSSIRVAAFEDASDTWSHGLAGYEGAEVGTFEAAEPWAVLDNGPLRATMMNTLRLGASSLLWRVFVQAGEPVVRMRLRLHWHGTGQIVKLLIPTEFGAAERTDGCPGGAVTRPLEGHEYPLHNSISLAGCEHPVHKSATVASQRGWLAAVSADVFSGDVQPDGTIRLTLLRSPAHAFHDPFKLPARHAYPITDQGVHEYEIALLLGEEHSTERIDDEANRQTAPIWACETTRGMPDA